MKIDENKIIEKALDRYAKEIDSKNNQIKNLNYILLTIKNYLKNSGNDELQVKRDNIIELLRKIK